MHDHDDYQEQDTFPFRCLGHDKNVFYYHSLGSRQVIALTPAQHNEPQLRAMASSTFWYSYVDPTKSGPDYKMAAEKMQHLCYQVGIFDRARLRGRGAWYDDGRCVLHLGNRVIIKGQEHNPASVPSEYIYEAGHRLRADLSSPLSTAEAKRYFDLVDMLPWESPMAARLLAGWSVCAHIGGVLNWRPHVWIIGRKGSGKTTVISGIVKRILGENCLFVQSETSEAGIRQTLGGDSLPVLFDEAESTDQRANQKIQNVLSLVRQSSSESGGMIAKGTTTGRSIHYSIRSCFAFASINANMMQESDKSRISVLEVNQDHKRFEYDEIKLAMGSLFRPGYVESFYARAIHLAPVIRENAIQFASVVAMELGEQRAGDQIGALLAGAYSLHSKKAIDYETARKWVRSQDWDTAKEEVRGNSDEHLLLGYLMDQRIKYRRTPLSNISDVPIGVLVDVVAGRIASDDYSAESAYQTLLQIGIKVDQDAMYISNTARDVQHLLRDSAWAHGHGRVLKRLPGASATANPISFGHSRSLSRATRIPI